MFCHSCGTEIKKKAIFCENCGTKVNEGINNEIFQKGGSHVGKKILFIIPIICCILAIILNLSCYVYESKLTVNVENMRQQAEDLALKNKFPEAVKLIDKAIGLRPNNKTLQLDKIALKDGESVSYFYNSLNSHDYVTAYYLLGSDWQTKTTYDKFRSGYLDTLSVNIESMSSSVNSDSIKVVVIIDASEKDGNSTKLSKYNATYTIELENNILKISHGKATKI